MKTSPNVSAGGALLSRAHTTWQFEMFRFFLVLFYDNEGMMILYGAPPS